MSSLPGSASCVQMVSSGERTGCEREAGHRGAGLRLTLLDSVSHRRLGLLILALLAFTTLLGVVLILTCRRPLSGKLTRR